MTTVNSRPLPGAADANGDADKKIISPKRDDVPCLRISRGHRGRANLAPHHRTALTASGISEAVMDARGYETLMRSNTDNGPRDRLKRAGFAVGAYREPQRFPGLLIPLYAPTGVLTSYQYRPDSPRTDERGKPRKYEAIRGRASVLDVHPHNFDKLADPTVPLWVTEGVKKGDALTTAGECVITLSGVFNWRGQYGTLGDWEDVPLKGRKVIICFDSDAATNRQVARAMTRLGRWLRTRGVGQVRFIVTPEVPGFAGKSGVDDYLRSGGTVAGLLAAAEASAPDPDAGDDSLTDSRLAEQLADNILTDSYRFVPGLGWLVYQDGRWRETGEERVTEEGRRYVKAMLQTALNDGAGTDRLKAIAGLQSAARIANMVRLTKGMDGVLAEVEDFDRDPELLNVANGVVNLRTGELMDHNPDLLMRHATPVAYRPGATHPDWANALQALPDAETTIWVQRYLGSAITGYTPREDVVTFWHGGGSNGKSTLLGAVQAAMGTYAKALLPTMLGGRRDEHPTEYMDLLGARLAFVEETGDGHRLDTVKLKKYIGTEVITARKMRQDSVSFRPSHTMVVTTNYRPVVTDTDHGTWRRLRMVPFPNTFGRDGAPVDRGLRSRLMDRPAQQEAVLAWLVEGAAAWLANELVLPDEPEAVKLATQSWRETTDLIYSFANERLTSAPGGQIEVETLRREFNDWLPSPHQPWGKQTFAERFEQHEALRALSAERGKDPKTRRACLKGIAFNWDD